MSEQMNEFLTSLTEFFTFFVVAVVLTIIFTVIYWAVTKHDEFKLIN